MQNTSLLETWTFILGHPNMETVDFGWKEQLLWTWENITFQVLNGKFIIPNPHLETRILFQTESKNRTLLNLSFKLHCPLEIQLSKRTEGENGSTIKHKE